jgi:hypothetical protein
MLKNKFWWKGCGVINGIIFIICLAFNMLYPLYNDDLLRINMQIVSKGHLLQQLYYDYYHLTGRILAQILEYLFLDKQSIHILFVVIAMITALCYVVINYIMYSVAIIGLSDNNVKKQIRKSKLCYAIFSFLFFIYFVKVFDFKECFEFKTISIQYIWIGTLFAVILYNFKGFFASSIWPIFYLIAGLLLSTYNEILNLMFIIALVFMNFYNWFYNKDKVRIDILIETNKSKRRLRYTLFLLGLLAGFILMLISPGTVERKQAAVAQLSQNHINYNIFQKIIYPFIHYHHVPFKVIVSSIILILFGLICFKSWKFMKFCKITQHIWITLLLWVVSLLILFPFAYTYSDRGGAWFGGRITIITDILHYLLFWQLLILFLSRSSLDSWFKRLRKYSLCWTILILSMTIAYLMVTLTSTLKEYNYNQAQIAYIKQKLYSKNMSFSFQSFYCKHKSWAHLSLSHDSFSNDSFNWSNVEYSKYYGAKSVKNLPCS